MMLSLAFILFGITPFQSQYHQDQFLYENFFSNKKNGIFVEVGASDGITISNTYFFEKELAWTGLCIEPSPEAFSKLKNNRKAICVQGCIADKIGTAEFIHVKGPCENLSGLKKTYSPKRLQELSKELQKHGGEKEVLSVPCYTLNELLKKNNIAAIDYLSINTQGGEFEIIQTINFDQFEIDVIGVENNSSDPRIKEFLNKKGFAFLKKMGKNEIYKKPRFAVIGAKERPTLRYIQQFLPENPVIVEAGAHVGTDTARMSHLWKSGMVYAFEPSPSVYARLRKKCGRRKNVKTFDIALGDHIGVTEFYESKPNVSTAVNPTAQGSILPPSQKNWVWTDIGFQKPIKVPITTLDAWAKTHNVKKVDFLWLDMQGSEFQMMKASPEILKTVKVIQTEVSRRPFYEGTVLLDEMQAWLETQGFVALYVTPDEHGDALFVRKP